jgi:hypothetical protein
MNDAGNMHTTTDSEPIGLEVRVLAFAYDRAEYEHATFYEYTLVYKGQAPLEDAFFAFYSDPYIGSFYDDNIGVDTTLGLALAYNGDDFDENNSYGGGYGTAPPAVGFDFLIGPRTEEGVLGMTRFGQHYNNADGSGNPSTAQEFWNLMRGYWRDGLCWTFGGDGRGGTECTDFIYPNTGTAQNPVPGYWSQTCPELPCGAHGYGGDPRFVIKSTGPYDMQPGESQTILFGIIWARGDDNFDSIQEVKRLSVLYQTGLPVAAEPEAAPPLSLELDRTYPNPASRVAVVGLQLPKASPVRVRVFDALGRVVAVLKDEELPPGRHEVAFDTRALSPGVYFVRAEAGDARATRPITVVR